MLGILSDGQMAARAEATCAPLSSFDHGRVSLYGNLNRPDGAASGLAFPGRSGFRPFPGIANLIARGTGFSPALIGMSIGLLGLIADSGEFQADLAAIFWSFAVTVAIVSAWAQTQFTAAMGFDAEPAVSPTFSAPLREPLIYAMTSTGSSVDFGIGSVAGVVIGSIIVSLQGPFPFGVPARNHTARC